MHGKWHGYETDKEVTAGQVDDVHVAGGSGLSVLYNHPTHTHVSQQPTKDKKAAKVRDTDNSERY